MLYPESHYIAHSAKRLNELADQISELEAKLSAKEEMFSGLLYTQPSNPRLQKRPTRQRGMSQHHSSITLEIES